MYPRRSLRSNPAISVLDADFAARYRDHRTIAALEPYRPGGDHHHAAITALETDGTFRYRKHAAIASLKTSGPLRNGDHVTIAPLEADSSSGN
jgi:hypothetical protein